MVTIHRYLLSEGRKLQDEFKHGTFPVKCFLLTQADEGPKALNFWLKQALTQGECAKSAMEAMHNANPKQNVWYNNATPMMCELHGKTLRVEEGASERAQHVPAAATAPTADEDKVGTVTRSTRGSKEAPVPATPQTRRQGAARGTRSHKAVGGPSSGLGKWEHLVTRITKIEV
jgi:hypothetical protein